jgi:hypothetical protein
MRLARSVTPWRAVEVFVIANLGFLALDVWVAHSVNRFAREPEWFPFYFSLVAPALLIVAAMLWRRLRRAARALGFLVGWTSTIVGIAGMVFHLQSHFFEQMTIRNLVYTAPFVAPLAYAGLGMLLILDRMVDSSSIEWVQWILFLALGGFAGNFVLSLADHAQNGFFNRMEWIPVVFAALGCAFLLMTVIYPLDLWLRRATWWILFAEVITGVAGFALHLHANLGQQGTLWERFLYGAPIFAPLLFANLAVLAAIGLWASVRAHVRMTAMQPRSSKRGRSGRNRGKSPSTLRDQRVSR